MSRFCITHDGFGGSVADRFPSAVETLPKVRDRSLPELPEGGVSQTSGTPTQPFKCQECGFDAKTPHGLARHIRTHGYGVLGRHIKG